MAENLIDLENIKNSIIDFAIINAYFQFIKHDSLLDDIRFEYTDPVEQIKLIKEIDES